MRLSRRVAGIAAGLVVALAASLAIAPVASASTRDYTSGHKHAKHEPKPSAPLGTNSLAAYLAAKDNGFDTNSYNYNIVYAAVGAVLGTKPNSPVAVLADGTQPLTAFLPTDGAFRVLVKDLTGTWVKNEQDVFAAVASLGIDTVEQVLLYHVVPGTTITKADALMANGAVLTTALGGTITVMVMGHWYRWAKVILADQDPNDRNPRVITFDINKGNVQIAHGINLVLRPADL